MRFGEVVALVVDATTTAIVNTTKADTTIVRWTTEKGTRFCAEILSSLLTPSSSWCQRLVEQVQTHRLETAWPLSCDITDFWSSGSTIASLESPDHWCEARLIKAEKMLDTKKCHKRENCRAPGSLPVTVVVWPTQGPPFSFPFAQRTVASGSKYYMIYPRKQDDCRPIDSL